MRYTKIAILLPFMALTGCSGATARQAHRETIAMTEPRQQISLQLDGPAYETYDDLARASDAAVKGVVVDVGEPFEVHPVAEAPKVTLVVTPVTFEVKQVLYGSQVQPGDRIQWLFPGGSTPTATLNSGLVTPKLKTEVLALMVREDKEWIRVALLADSASGLDPIGGKELFVGAADGTTISAAAEELAASKQRVGERVVAPSADEPAPATATTAPAGAAKP